MSESAFSRSGFDARSVLAAIYDPCNATRVVWSPSTTLHQLNIEHYPFHPRDNYRKMKKILAQLCEEGHLTQRAARHNDDTGLNEIAYSRVPGR